jgi:transcriptional regulator with XRE-family HTH domain
MREAEYDVRAVRERLGLTPEALAATLQVTEREVRGWEDGSIRPDRRILRQLEYLDAKAEWDAGMAAAGVSECEWLKPRLLRLEHLGAGKEQVALVNEIVSHAETCEACRARNEWARDHPPPMPPTAGFGRVIQATGTGIGRLPEWARPAAFGAVVVAAITSVRALFLIPAMVAKPAILLAALATVLLGAAAGAVGGLAFSLIRPKLARLGRMGDYLTGIVCMAAYLGAFGVVALLEYGIPPGRDLVMWLVIGGFCTVLFGIAMGRGLHGPRSGAER